MKIDFGIERIKYEGRERGGTATSKVGYFSSSFS